MRRVKRQTEAAASASWRRTESKKRAGLGPRCRLADETAATVIELSGVIKWFDVSKGYGFIVPDNGMPDILVARDLPAPRRLPDRLRRRARGLRGAAAAEGPAVLPHPLDGRIDGDPSGRRCRRRAPTSR